MFIIKATFDINKVSLLDSGEFNLIHN